MVALRLVPSPKEEGLGLRLDRSGIVYQARLSHTLLEGERDDLA